MPPNTDLPLAPSLPAAPGRPVAADLPVAIALERASNLRDLGGWPTQDGRRVRTGLVFRAPTLIGLTDADRAVIARLGLRTAIDFRGVQERANNPVILQGVAHIPEPIEPSVGASLRDIVLTGQASGHVSPEDMLELLTDAYRAYAVTSFPRYRALFAALANDASLPLMFHCSAGKDRTGFGAALLLTALGVAWEHVLADYLATNRLWRREIARNFDLPAPVKDILLSVHESLLTAAFAAATDAYGTIDAYLDQAIGLDRSAISKLQSRLLEPAEP
jgi:protein-tyrosine phosphatase